MKTEWLTFEVRYAGEEFEAIRCPVCRRLELTENVEDTQMMVVECASNCTETKEV